MGVRFRVHPQGESPDDAILYEFAQDRVLLGRAPGCDVLLPHTSVSAKHATIEFDRVGYAVVDHESTNGIYLNAKRIVAGRRKMLRDGDELILGVFVLRFDSQPSPRATSREETTDFARRLSRLTLREPLGFTHVVHLNGTKAGQRYTFPTPPARIIIGRSTDCDILVDDGDASREHAEFIVDPDFVLIRDLKSKNGVLVNEKVVLERRLHDRDEICIGETILCFEDPLEKYISDLEAKADTKSEPVLSPVTEGPLKTIQKSNLGGDQAGLADRGEDQSNQSGASEESNLGAPKVNSQPPEGTERTLQLKRKNSSSPAEYAVLALALIVLVFSGIGLVWLLR